MVRIRCLIRRRETEVLDSIVETGNFPVRGFLRRISSVRNGQVAEGDLSRGTVPGNNQPSNGTTYEEKLP